MNPAVQARIPDLTARYGEEKVQRQVENLQRHGDVVEDPVLWLETALRGEFRFVPIERVTTCLCGARDSRLLGRFVFWNLLGVRQCRRCGLLFVSPRLTADAVANDFTTAYFDHADLEHWGRRRHPVFRDVQRVLRAHGAHSVYDVGAAYGDLVHWLGRRGIDAAGCDVSRPAVEMGRARLGVTLDVRDDEWTPPSGKDAVLSLDALYYAADPVAELRLFRSMVRPGGLLVLRLRNSIWTKVRAWRRDPTRVGPPLLTAQHLWGFAPATVTPLLRTAGWRVLRCEPAAHSSLPIDTPVRAVTAAYRTAARMIPRLPVVTHSFNVVAERVD